MTAAYFRDREHSIDPVDSIMAKRRERKNKPIELTYVSDGLSKNKQPLESTYVTVDPSMEYVTPLKEFKQP